MSITHHDEEQLAAPASLIARPNASNHRCVITGPPGDGYQPSQFGYQISSVEGTS